MIGVTPSGLVNFVSLAAADKAVFNITDPITKFKPGDAVMIKSLHSRCVVQTNMLDSLGSQLREAEARRTAIERVHQETLAQIRNISEGNRCDNELIENLKSKARELEKKVALETVRCEELQLELSSEMKLKTTKHCTCLPATISTTSVSWASPINQDQNAEVDIIMAKIEQDNRVLAELDESRSSATTLPPPSSTKSKGHTDFTALASMGPTISAKSNSLTPAGISICSGTLSSNTVSVSSHLNNESVQQLNTSCCSGANTIDKTLIGSIGTNVTSVSPKVFSLKNLPVTNQSTTMPILSLHNSHQAASSGCLGLSGVSVNSYVHPNLSSLLDTNSISGNGLTTVTATTGSSLYGIPSIMPGLTTYSPPLMDSAQTSFPYTGTIRNSKPKLLDDGDYTIMRYPNRSSPCSPLPTAWGFDDYGENINVNLMHLQRGIGIGSSLEMETRGHVLNGTSEPQVDMLDIPGKGRCCVFIARFPYDPPEESEGELPLSAGDYLLVWNSGEPQTGYLDAELLDGRRGLVPASFVQRLIGDDLLEFHQAVLSTLRDAEDCSMQCDATTMPALPSNNPLLMHTQEDLARLSESQTDVENESDIDDMVPAPKHLTLEKQMNKSVLISWSPGDPTNNTIVECYHVYVDGVLKVTVKATERTRALIEGVDSARPHRISVRSVSQTRKTSRDAACTMIIGRDTSHLGPSSVRAGNITCSSAVISWLPANSNHQHVICVNNVEVRVVKPGIYRHTITGLSPSTQYRVTVRAKHLRASGRMASQNGRPTDEAPGAYADFRTLTKGLPDPPQDIQLEAGPQDGTILVTWQPVNRPSSSGPVTGYAVYADGKKVTDINSPTGDHALIDIGKLTGLNPKAVTIRTKSRDSQSADSPPILIPNVVRTAASRKAQVTILTPGRVVGQGVHPDSEESSQINALQQNEGGSSILGGLLGGLFSKNQSVNPPDNGLNVSQRNSAQNRPTGPQSNVQSQGQQQQQQQQQQQNQPFHSQQHMQSSSIQGRFIPTPGVRGQMNSQHHQMQMMQQQQMAQKQARYFIAMFDYDPSTMSPNPDGCEEELPFREGDTIRVYGDKDSDGFYWGELRGRRGFVPHNMVTEVDETQTFVGSTISTTPAVQTNVPTTTQSMRNISRDRWGDIYANTPVKRMIALYDYDPQELSPNVDAEVELCFKTGEIILVYGDMDEDGFYMGELDGVRGLVPSNFLADAPEQFNNQVISGSQNVLQRSMNNRSKGQGPGARGPPPPPRENILAGVPGQRCALRKDARPASPTLLDNTGHPAPDHLTQVTQEITDGNDIYGHISAQQQEYDPQQAHQQQQQPSITQNSGGGLLSGASNLLSGATQAATGTLFGSKFKTDQSSTPNATQQNQQQPQGLGTLFGGGNQQQVPIKQQQQNQQQTGQAPGFISKLNEMTAPGSDILSKAKDSFFGKFGFGK